MGLLLVCNRSTLNISTTQFDQYIIIPTHTGTLVDLIDVINSSLSPQPITYVVDAVVDTKSWMSEQTLPLHDHLKAHQFKFEHSHTGETLMFYKEWSTDSFWLPSGGLSILPTNQPVPSKHPLVLQPFFDEDGITKLEATIRKIGGYLDKADAASWWTTWLQCARKQTSRVPPQKLRGVCECTMGIVSIVHPLVSEIVGTDPISYNM